MAAASVQHVARGLEAAIPIDATPEERAAVERVIAASDAVAHCLLEREQSPARVMPAYRAFTSIWSVFNDTLAAVSRLPGAVSARGPRAAALASEVLPEGIAFVQLDAGQAWSAGARRLQHIDDEGLAPAIGEVIGADLLEAVRGATLRLREAVGAGPGPSDIASPTAVADKVATFSRLVGIYCRLLASKVDESNAATLERFRRAIGPLIDYRATRRAQGEPEEDEAVDVPVGTPPIAPGLPGAPPFEARPPS